MTLGDVYDLDLKKNEQAIKEVVLQAQGEVSVAKVIDQLPLLLKIDLFSSDGPRGILA
jgi:hypothetical protein